jgi:hypothetical protein
MEATCPGTYLRPTHSKIKNISFLMIESKLQNGVSYMYMEGRRLNQLKDRQRSTRLVSIPIISTHYVLLTRVFDVTRVVAAKSFL